MRLRFKTALCFIFMLIICVISIGIGYMSYKETTDPDIVVDGDITINYLNGKKFNLNGDGEINFSVTNNNSEQQYYYIQLTDVYAKDVSYELKSSDNLEIANNLKSDIITNQIAINGNETVNYTLKFVNNGKENYSGVIQVGVKSNEENTFSNVILNNNQSSDTTLSTIGDASTLEEGLISSQDDLGVTYYFRGNVSNNYVSFGDFLWRIVKINGDGSVKLVLNNLIEQTSKYTDSEVKFSGSTINNVLDDWFTNNLSNYSDYVAYYKFCNDLTVESSGIYAASSRILTNKIPNLVCLGEAINAKIGLLTADEVMLAGASTTENKTFYLYNEEITNPYYTMTSANLNGTTYYPFVINTDGAMTSAVSADLVRGVRPVINIIKTAKVEGDGTIDNPYKIIINSK